MMGIIALGQCAPSRFGIQGNLTSPGFPSTYPDEVTKTWSLEVEEGFVLKLDFTDFSLEESYDSVTDSCQYDYVEVNSL